MSRKVCPLCEKELFASEFKRGHECERSTANGERHKEIIALLKRIAENTKPCKRFWQRKATSHKSAISSIVAVQMTYEQMMSQPPATIDD